MCYVFYLVAGGKHKCSGAVKRTELYPEMYSNYYQGDIVFFGDGEKHPHSASFGSQDELKNGLRAEIFRWPNATIPYVLGSNFSEYTHTVTLQPLHGNVF